mmetsp:Transcript_28658/g.59658  ORF Transcript_28658/g.59658 Transcript_28658/m.59658 type:complete len:595 (-) Transcript_28658:318-2102(-)
MKDRSYNYWTLFLLLHAIVILPSDGFMSIGCNPLKSIPTQLSLRHEVPTIERTRVKHPNSLISIITQQLKLFSQAANRQNEVLEHSNVNDKGAGVNTEGENIHIITRIDQDGKSRGLYVHIPYCRRRCNYCDFAIVPIGPHRNNNNEIENNDSCNEDSTSNDNTANGSNKGFLKMDADYKNAILAEIRMIKATFTTSASSSSEKMPLRSIYFGGGTPSLAPLSTLRDIVFALIHAENAPFTLQSDAEMTIEMDPGTFSLSTLSSLKELGFNRVSLGVQSFDDNILSIMGRVHRSRDVYRSIEMIKEVYGEDHANYSIDLISGVPGLTLAGWTETLYEAVRLNPRPRHISLYDLQVEKGTAFGRWYADEYGEDLLRKAEDGDVVSQTHVGLDNLAKRRPSLPSSEDCAFMYRYASGYLRSMNYEHYEISSYAYIGEKETHRSRHNQIYWEIGGEWYAIGLGATSKIDGVRFARPRALVDYVKWSAVLKEESSKSGSYWTPPWLLVGEEDEEDELLDIVMTRLRTSDGLDLDWIAKNDLYGRSVVEDILRGFQLALDLDLGIRIPGSEFGYIKLKDPDGMLFSNNIISNIFVELAL